MSKKSWHVKNMNNQEKVWMAEQRKANEESKTKELARQIQQEREQDELDAIAGKKSSHLDRGIAWMHEGGKGEAAKEDQRKQDEEFLLGKAYAPEGVKGGDFAVDEVQDGVNVVIASAAAAAGPALAALPSQAGPSVADKNEAFRMRHEDPMFLVSKRYHEQQAKAEKTKALYERVVGPQNIDSGDSYEERKKAKRAKKERKRKHRYRNDDDDDRKHRKHRHRSRSRDRKEDDEDRHIRKHSKQPYRSCSRSLSNESRTRLSPDRSDRTDYHHRDSHRSREYRRDERSSETRRRRVEDSKYGLQGSSRRDLSMDDLGPNRELLEKKRQEMNETRRSIMRGKTSNRNKMSEEERAKALEDMKSDASRRADAARTRPRDQDEDPPKRASASFLSDMKKKTRGVEDTSTHSLSTRVRENRHRNQKLDDSFL